MEGKLTETERLVVAALRDIDDNWKSIGDGSAAWTRAIKDSVGRIGLNQKFNVFAAQCEFEDNGEWLFDLCWCHEDQGILVDIPLVMEIEWDPYGLLDDFQKLIVARASHRVMVSWHPNESGWNRSVEQFRTQVKAYRGTTPTDRYLLCGWIDKPDELRICLLASEVCLTISEVAN